MLTRWLFDLVYKSCDLRQNLLGELHLLCPIPYVDPSLPQVIMELPNQHSVPALKISQDLLLVSGALQDIKDSRMLQPVSPGIPPAAFGAGGSMWAASFYYTSTFSSFSGWSGLMNLLSLVERDLKHRLLLCQLKELETKVSMSPILQIALDCA